MCWAKVLGEKTKIQSSVLPLRVFRAEIIRVKCSECKTIITSVLISDWGRKKNRKKKGSKKIHAAGRDCQAAAGFHQKLCLVAIPCRLSWAPGAGEGGRGDGHHSPDLLAGGHRQPQPRHRLQHPGQDALLGGLAESHHRWAQLPAQPCGTASGIILSWIFLFSSLVPDVIDGKTFTSTVVDLNPWVEYEFRVVASNKIGGGEPSLPSEKVRTEEAG